MSLQKWFADRGIGPMGGFIIGGFALVVIFMLLLAAAGTNIFDFSWDLVFDPAKPHFHTKVVATTLAIIGVLIFAAVKIMNVFKNKQ